MHPIIGTLQRLIALCGKYKVSKLYALGSILIFSCFFAYGEGSYVQQSVTTKIELKDKPDTIMFAGKKTLVYYSKVLDSQPVYIPAGMKGMMSFLSHNIAFTSSCYQPEGRVIAKCLVTEEGKVECVEIIQSLAEHEDSEVVRLVSMMTFTPALLNGRPVASWFLLPITFRNADH